MMSANHTALPWQVSPLNPDIVQTADKTTIAETYAKNCDANAAHIVRCVNAHDELIAALEEAADVLEGCAQRLGNPPGILDLCIGSARAAIARAKGES